MVPGAPRQVICWLAVALLTVASCSSGDGNSDARAGGAPTTSIAEPSDDQPAVPAPDTPGAPDGEAPQPTNGAPGPAPPAPTAPTSAGSPPAASAAPAPGGVGAFAAFYLRPQESARLLVDLRSQSGAAPSAGTVSHLTEVLSGVSGKEVRIDAGSVSGSGREWSADEIRALADSGGPTQSRDPAVMRLLFLRGGFAGDDTVLGAAVRSDVAAIFADRITEAAGPLGNRSRIEDAITIHEVGHLLGLVDLVLDRGRADPDHPGHSPNRESVMYYAVESTLVGSILSGGPPTSFDADDLADLAAIRDG